MAKKKPTKADRILAVLKEAPSASDMDIIAALAADKIDVSAKYVAEVRAKAKVQKQEAVASGACKYCQSENVELRAVKKLEYSGKTPDGEPYQRIKWEYWFCSNCKKLDIRKIFE